MQEIWGAILQLSGTSGWLFWWPWDNSLRDSPWTWFQKQNDCRVPEAQPLNPWKVCSAWPSPLATNWPIGRYCPLICYLALTHYHRFVQASTPVESNSFQCLMPLGILSRKHDISHVEICPRKLHFCAPLRNSLPLPHQVVCCSGTTCWPLVLPDTTGADGSLDCFRLWHRCAPSLVQTYSKTPIHSLASVPADTDGSLVMWISLLRWIGGLDTNACSFKLNLKFMFSLLTESLYVLVCVSLCLCEFVNCLFVCAKASNRTSEQF